MLRIGTVVARFGSLSEVAALGMTFGAWGLALMAAISGHAATGLILLVISIIGEFALIGRAPRSGLLLQQADLGPSMRAALRIPVALLLTAHADSLVAVRTFVVAAIILSLILCGQVLHIQYRLLGPLKPMTTRNIPGDTSIAELPPANAVPIALSQLAIFAPMLLGAAGWIVGAIAAIALAYLAAHIGAQARSSWVMRQHKRRTGYTPPLERIQNFLDDYRPEVLVHLSGPPGSGYQINTWLEALESIDQRVFIVLRDPPLMSELAKTSIPTLCLPAASELMMLEFDSAKVALYPSNTGNNIHLLRLPHIMSAFIGHGDSDKSASSNPFSRVYDELWVAGEAGADRYRRSGLGMFESQYRYVGRPQVHDIAPTPRLGDEEIPTVLYAPTWEGVNLEQEYSSVSIIGAKLVSRLLASEPRIRVIYKPHPFTGQRDAKYRAVDAQIAAALQQAKAATGIDHRVIRRGAIVPWFNRASALITDISSVVSDFLASEKPYAVFNHTEHDEAAFREQFPSTRAATIIDREGHGIEDFIAVVTKAAADERGGQRADLAGHLLGAPEQRTLLAFNAAVNAFIARSDIDRAQYRANIPAGEDHHTMPER